MSAKFTCCLILLQIILFSNLQAQNINTIAGGVGDQGIDTSAELHQPTGVAADKWGNIFIADAGNHVVRKVDTNGIITTYAGAQSYSGFSGDGGPAILARLYSPMGVVVDTFGNLFISDEGNNRIREVNAAGIITTYAGNGTLFSVNDGVKATLSSVYQPYGIALDKKGNLYIAERGDNRVRKVSLSDTITTVAGNGIAGFSGDHGLADTSEINMPWAVCVDAKGNIFIADKGNYRIRKVDTSGIITTIAGNGIVGYSGDGGPATVAEFNNLSGISADSLGDIYVSDSVNAEIRRIDTSGIITRFAGSLLINGFSGDGGLDTAAKLNTPEGTAFDKKGNFYIADYSNNRIRKVNTTGIIKTFAGSNFYSSAGYKGDGGPAILALLSNPSGVVFDTMQNLYIADRGNHVVRMVNSAGIISTFAGNDTSGTSGDGGLAIHAQLSTPASVATDRKGNLFICDQGRNMVRKVNRLGIISTYAGNGVPGFRGDGGKADTAELSTPAAIATDKYGNLYIADQNNNRIRKIDTNQVITTIAGTAIATYYGDGGPAILAEFNSPAGLCLDTTGNIYIADRNNYRVRKIDLAGNISTIAGNGAGGYSGDGAAAISAGINLPQVITVDRSGNLFIEASDYFRKVNTAGIISTIAGNGEGGFYGDGGPAISSVLSEGPFGGMVTDAYGNLLIPDYLNNRIREIYNASITIATASDTVCTGSPIATFTATATAPSIDTPIYYHWLKNSLPVGSNNVLYTATGLSNGDKIMCYISNNSTGSGIASSNQITMIVGTFTPTVAFTVSPTSALCTPTLVVCTPHAINGGSLPVYDWYKNSIHVITAGTYSFTPANGDNVYCRLTSNASCLVHDTASSPHTIFTITPPIIPSLTVTYSPSGAVCPGTVITFTPHQVGFTTPVYIWYKNDTLVYTGQPYVFSPLNGSVVYCKVKGSSSSCVTIDSAISASDTFHLSTATLVPSVNVTVSPAGALCEGTPVSCTPHPTNGGVTPIYNWYKNNTLAYTGSTFNFTPLNGDKVYCKLTSNASCLIVDTAVSAVDTFTLSIPVLLPSVTITASPGDTVCAGMLVNCSSSIINGGSAPVRHWYRNNILADSGSVYSFIPTAGDVVYCKLTSNAFCLLTDTAKSNKDTFAIRTPTLIPSVNISVSPGDTICPGTVANCNATLINGGASPKYYWYLNGSLADSNGAYSFVPVSGNVVYCKLVSDAFCLIRDTATSEKDTFAIKPATLLPSVNISITPGDTLCTGTNVTCNPIPANGGTSPQYYWYKDGSYQHNGSSYSFIPTNNDVVYCKLKSNAGCLLIDSAFSRIDTFAVNSPATPSVSISLHPGDSVCSGTNVTCTPIPVNGGTSPTYEWYRDGAFVSSGNTLGFVANNNTAVYCILTSNRVCIASSTATSPTAQIAVAQNVTPSVSVRISPRDSICPGTQVKCTATGVNGGTDPVYDWYVNNNKVFTDSVYDFIPSDRDSIFCTLISNAACASPASVNSSQSVFDVEIQPSIVITSNLGPVISKGNKVTFTASVTGNSGPYTFHWMINGVTVSVDSTYTYTTDSFSIWDSISCIITTNNGCAYTAKSNSLLIDVYHSMKLYPNPTDGDFVINGNDSRANGDGVNISIYNTVGRLVYEKKAAFDGDTFYTDINLGRQLPPGVYLLKLEYDNKKIPLVFVVRY